MEELAGRQLLALLAARAADPAWRDVWQAIAFLGSADFFAVSLPLLFAFAPMRWALRLGLAFAASATTSEALKAAIGRPRMDPLEFGLPGALEDPGVYANHAFPSGHTLMAVVLWGTVAANVRSPWLRGGCVALVAAIAFSRLALLRHDLIDVGGGLVIGAALLAALVAGERAWGDSLARLPRVERAGLWLLAALALQLALGLEITAVVLGVGAGLGVGAIAGAGRKRRTVRVPLGRGILRAGLAVGGVAGVRWLAEPGAGHAPMLLFALYFVGALWVSGIVPSVLGGVFERDDGLRTAPPVGGRPPRAPR